MGLEFFIEGFIFWFKRVKRVLGDWSFRGFGGVLGRDLGF
jgi:hypothetical protein